MQNSAILGLQPPIGQFTNPPASGSVSHGLLEQINAKSAPGHMPSDSMGGGRDHSCNAISMSAKSFTPFFYRPHICFLSFGLSKVQHSAFFTAGMRVRLSIKIQSCIFTGADLKCCGYWPNVICLFIHITCLKLTI